jgi:tetratricopeptide (TPR) repeat protein
MPDLEAEMERAVSLYIRGRAEEAIEIARPLLRRARGTPHAARFYRYMSEFLLASGDYDRSRETARESGSLARAIRHPGEILASTLMIMACDFYQGLLRQVHRQLEELLHLATDQPMPVVFMGQVTLLLGDFDRTVSLLEQARGVVDAVSEPDAHPAMDLFRSNMLIQTGKAHLLAGRPTEAISLFERAMGLQVDTPVPGTLAQAMLGYAVVIDGGADEGLDLLQDAVGTAQEIAHDVHGHTLIHLGLAHKHLGDLTQARELLRNAVGLLTHPLERQEGYCSLGDIAASFDLRSEAEQAYRRGTQPTIDSYFGRKAVGALHGLVGLQPL